MNISPGKWSFTHDDKWTFTPMKWNDDLLTLSKLRWRNKFKGNGWRHPVWTEDWQTILSWFLDRWLSYGLGSQYPRAVPLYAWLKHYMAKTRLKHYTLSASKHCTSAPPFSVGSLQFSFYAPYWTVYIVMGGGGGGSVYTLHDVHCTLRSVHC